VRAPSTAALSSDLALALRLADEADALTLTRFRASDLRVATKPDLTPVTDADLAVERLVRAALARQRPGDGVLGEEDGEQEGTSGRRWVLDPVDGTKSYARGVPVWATLLALEVAGPAAWEPVLGVVSAPALHRRWWATRGGGAWLSDALATEPRRLAVSSVAALADASLSYSSLSGWDVTGRLPALLALTRAVWRTRGYGDFLSHVLVAEGVIDLSAEPEVSRWDLAALTPIVEEAGGALTDLRGTRGPGGGSVLASNGLLHDAARAVLSGAAG